MKSSAKRLLSLVIVLAMALSMLPMVAFAADAPTTLYVKPNANWLQSNARFAAYFFGNGETWADCTDADGDGVYEVAVPEGYPSVIFCRMNPSAASNSWSNKWNQTADLKVPTDGTNCYVVADGTWDKGAGQWVEYTADGGVGETEPTTASPIEYSVAGEAALCGNAWAPEDINNMMTDEDADGIYTITYENVAAGTYQFKVTDGTWNNSWGKPDSADNYSLTLDADAETVEIRFDTATNLITVVVDGVEPTEPSEDPSEEPSTEPSEEPSTEPAGPKEYCLVGYINGADYGCNDDYENVGEYIFVDGALVTSFTADSYIFVKTTDNANWYLAEAYCSDTTCTFVSGASEKMFVPGNVELTFTLVENEDGSVTVSYVTGEEIPTESTEPSESTESIPTDPVGAAYYVAGTMNGWDPAYTEHKMNDNGDGTYSLTLTLTAGAYEFKVTDGTWTNSWGDGTGNFAFTTTADGDVTINFNSADNSITVTGEYLEEVVEEPLVIDAVYVAGAAELLGTGWDPTVNQTTNTDGVYTLVIENVAAGTYEYKFVANGTWELNWAAGVENVSGETYTAWFNATGNNSVVVTEDGSTVTLTLDLTTMDPITGEGGTCSALVEAPVVEAPSDPLEIVDAAYALAGGESLPYTATLTGEIISVDTAYNATYSNITVTIAVPGREDKPIQCFRLKGEGADQLAVGDTITVTGTLKNYEKTDSETGEVISNTIEFDAGCTLDSYVKGENVIPTEPADILAAAYALETGTALDYSSTLTGKVTVINTPYSSTYGNITVTIAVEGFEDKPVQCFRLKGDYADVLKVGDTITVTGVLSNYKGTVQFGAGCTLDAYVEGEGEEIIVPEDPKEIVDAAYALEAGAALPYEATLTGKVTEIVDAYSETYKNITVNMVIEGREEYPILCYRMKGDGADTLAVGDTITVTGNIKNYGGTIEFTPCTLVAVEKAPAGVTVSGAVTSFGDASAAVVVELWKDGAVAYTAVVADGNYTFETVAAGSYTLKVSKINHVTREYAVTVEAEAVALDVKICLIGDVTGDGRVNVADTGRVYAHVKGTSELTDYAFACGDVSGDGKINVADTGRIYAHVKGSKLLF